MNEYYFGRRGAAENKEKHVGKKKKRKNLKGKNLYLSW